MMGFRYRKADKNKNGDCSKEQSPFDLLRYRKISDA